MSNRVNFTSPVGRLVMGSLYKPSTKDADGNPLVFKSGSNAGQARVNYFMALAIPKTGEGHWKHTAWGQAIYAVGVAAFPQTHSNAQFAWKVADGDNKETNSRGKRNCDTEGFAGNWILRFSGSYAPKVYREENGAYVQVTEEGYIKPGYYIQISGSISGNKSQQRPGLFLNHSMVAFAAFGPEIHFGLDANSVGFGASPLPAGALQTPPASNVPLPAAPPFVSGQMTANLAPLAAPVTPNPSFLNVPQAATVPVQTAAVPAPPTPAFVPTATTSPSRVMTALAGGASYLSFRTAGWTDEQLIAKGMMV